jgi:hypothetical protein
LLSFLLLHPSVDGRKRVSELCRALIRPLVDPPVSAETAGAPGPRQAFALASISSSLNNLSGWRLLASSFRLLIIGFDCRQTLQLSSGLAAQVFWFFFFFGGFFLVTAVRTQDDSHHLQERQNKRDSRGDLTRPSTLITLSSLGLTL